MDVNKIHLMLEDLQAALKEVFPDSNTFSFNCSNDGYITFSAYERRIVRNKDCYRYDLTESKVDGEWGLDMTSANNEYLKEHGMYCKGRNER